MNLNSHQTHHKTLLCYSKKEKKNVFSQKTSNVNRSFDVFFITKALHKLSFEELKIELSSILQQIITFYPKQNKIQNILLYIFIKIIIIL